MYYINNIIKIKFVDENRIHAFLGNNDDDMDLEHLVTQS